VTAATLVLRRPDGGGLVARANRSWLRLGARLLCTPLDRRLASGVPPESAALLAARAGLLVAPGLRQALVRHWGGLLAQARGPAPARRPAVPLCRERVVAAQDEARAMLRALSAASPTPARGVAMASVLLHDGAGPLYNARCPTDLGAALDEVTAHLDPLVPLAGLA